MPTASRRGRAATWSAASMASPSAACSPASPCSRAPLTPPRSPSPRSSATWWRGASPSSTARCTPPTWRASAANRGLAAASSGRSPPRSRPRRGRVCGPSTSALSRRSPASRRRLSTPNDLAPHEGPQRLGHDDAPVLLLVLLEDGDERTPHRQRRPVERVDQAGLGLRLRPVADLGAPGLEVAEVRAARDLAVGAGAGEPDLEVVRPLRAEAHVARAEQAHPVVQVEAPEHLLGVAG